MLRRLLRSPYPFQTIPSSKISTSIAPFWVSTTAITSPDPVYLDTLYYLDPDGPVAEETLQVIGAAMAEASVVVGLGHPTLSRRERVIAVEPRGSGMALFMLRAADEVRARQFGGVETDLDTEMVAIARAIIGQRTGSFDPGRIETATRRPCAS